jgi:glucosaminylphosphatidylinositol acyltransferase
VTEYGVHWNFFITLGLLPPFVTFLRLVKGKRLPYSVFAALIMGAYQWALIHAPIRGYQSLTAFIVSADRNDLFSQNREGIFSFLGTILKRLGSN